MPEPISDAIKDKVKAVALQIGVREAARAFEISEGTVSYWSAKEGWMKEKAEIEALKQNKEMSQAGSSIKISDVMSKYEGKTKLYSAKVCYLTAKELQKKKGDELLALAAVNKDNVSTAAKLHNWQAPANQTLVNINLTGQRFDKAD